MKLNVDAPASIQYLQRAERRTELLRAWGRLSDEKRDLREMYCPFQNPASAPAVEARIAEIDRDCARLEAELEAAR